jgi:Uma2 family endonuclease
MSALIAPNTPSRIVYPETDGLPIAENTLQFEWIVTIKGGLDHLLVREPEVFVAGALFWYPVQGHPEIRIAPDVMVAFGRPKGHRLSYLQWEECGITPGVVFEVLSHRVRFGEMLRQFEFYQRHGVEEYYIIDPDPKWPDLSGFFRQRDKLVEIPTMNGHVSPRLNVRFELGDQGVQIIRPDGEPFLTYAELARRLKQYRGDAAQERSGAKQPEADVEQPRHGVQSPDEGPGE